MVQGTIQVFFGSVFLAAIVDFIVAAVWFSPLGIAPQWMAAMKEDKRREWFKKDSAPKYMLTSMITSVIKCYVLAHALAFAESDGIGEALVGAFWNWFGFVFAVQLPNACWADMPWPLFFINVGQQLLSTAAAAIVLGGIPAFTF